MVKHEKLNALDANVFDHIPKKTRGDPRNLAYDGMHIMKKKLR